MATKAQLKALLADKYDYKETDIDDTTRITDIVGSDTKLGIHLQDLSVDLSPRQLEDAVTVGDLVKLL
ncbi:hypothetical protein [Pseudomonas shirazensis]|uniref:hypothetical protein n=1 Tax=Pseudomonas shirazensis TaxID=2745494 RepID=UPI003D27D837